MLKKVWFPGSNPRQIGEIQINTAVNGNILMTKCYANVDFLVLLTVAWLSHGHIREAVWQVYRSTLKYLCCKYKMM